MDAFEVIADFKPCIMYNDALRVTEMIMEDVPTVWCPWGPYKGHAVDCGYAMDDGRLVGMKIWDDVRARPAAHGQLSAMDTETAKIHADVKLSEENDELIAENKRLRNECAHLQFCLNSRDEYLGRIGKWEAYCATLPAGKAGVAGGWAAAHGQGAPTPAPLPDPAAD